MTTVKTAEKRQLLDVCSSSLVKILTVRLQILVGEAIFDLGRCFERAEHGAHNFNRAGLDGLICGFGFEQLRVDENHAELIIQSVQKVVDFRRGGRVQPTPQGLDLLSGRCHLAYATACR